MLLKELLWTMVFTLFLVQITSQSPQDYDRTELFSGSDSELASIHSVQRRNVNEGERHFVLRAFGEERHLRLRRSDIFHPDFKALYAKKSDDGEIHILEHENFNKRDIGDIYSVDKGSGSLVIPNNDESQIEGILDNNYRIAPQLTSNNSAPNNATHLLYKMMIPVPTKNDFIHPDPPAVDDSITERVDPGPVPDTITVEILVLFDYKNSKRLDFDFTKISQYVGIFWNSVTQRYANTSNPNIKFSLAGLVSFKSPDQEPFLEAHKFNATHVNDTILPAIRDWVKKKMSGLPKHDVVMMHLGRDAGSIQRGVWKDSVAGLGYIGTACRGAEGYSLGFAEDTAPIFSGVITASHEVGHVLNCPHDGIGSAKRCSANNGNIMNAVEGANRNWQFSSCSLSIMKQYVSAPAQRCLWDTPSSKYPILSDYPSTMAGTLDDQCKRRYKDENFVFRGAVTPTICKYLWCSKNDSKSMVAHGGAVEGTMCDIRKICIGGICTSNNIPTLDQQCKDRFDGSYAAVNKYKSTVCQELKCRSGTVLKDFGPARNGSICGRAGVCRDGHCVGQIFPLELQCQRNFGEKFYYYDKADSNEVCGTLWCTEDGSNLKSFGPAEEYSECGSGRMCRKKTCVAVEY